MTGLRPAALVFLIAIPASVNAQSNRLLREARSENRRFELKIDPGRGGKSEESRCRGTLVERGEEKDREQRIWQERLVNEKAPARAFIHDEGRYVVTLDEYRYGGARHALVVYDEAGKPKAEFGLRDLLHKRDWKHVKARGKSIEWLQGARFTFADEPARFRIQLRGGGRIEIDLEKAEPLDPPKEGEASDAEIPAELRALLDGETGGGEIDLSKIDDETIHALMQKLTDGEKLSTEELALLSEAYVAGRLLTDCEGGQALEAAIVEARLKGEDVFLPDELSHTARIPAGDPATAPPAGNSAAAGAPIPSPNPAAPIDYIGWLNDQVQTQGDPAAPVYQAAIDSMTPWVGDADLYTRAESGDIAALTSPEIAAWLDSNAQAMSLMMQGNALEYRGMPMHSEDGTMLGILLPHCATMRQAAKMMVMKGRQLEAGGNASEAVEYFVQGTRLGAQASHGPTLIENLVGQAVQALSSESLLDTMERDAGALDYASLAQRLENEYQPARPVAQTFQYERTFVLDLLQSAYEYDSGSESYRVSQAGLKKMSASIAMASDGKSVDPGAEAALGVYLGSAGFENLVNRANDHYDMIGSAAMAPYAEGREMFANAEAKISNPMFRATDPILSQLLPALSRSSELSTRNEAQRRATMLVANLKAYRQQNGAYPDSLESMGGRDFVVDPYSRQQFAYRRDGDNFSLYSLGSNMSDEGGVHDPRKSVNDIVYWPRPPKQ